MATLGYFKGLIFFFLFFFLFFLVMVNWRGFESFDEWSSVDDEQEGPELIGYGYTIGVDLGDSPGACPK